MSTEQEISEKISKISDKQAFIAYSIFLFIAILSIVIIALFQSVTDAVIILFSLFINLIPQLFIPLIIRNYFKKIFNNKQALIYTIVAAIISVILNGGHFNILAIFWYLIPYYYLSNKPLFKTKSIKYLSTELENLK